MKTRKKQQTPKAPRTPQPAQQRDFGSNAAALAALNEQADLDAALRPLPNGANIHELVVDDGAVINTCDALSRDGLLKLAARTPTAASAETLAKHPTLPDMMRRVLKSGYFSASPFWTSNWQEDGKTDWYSLGATSVSMKVDLVAHVRDLGTVADGQAAFSSTASANAGVSQSQTEGISGSVGGEIGTPEGAKADASIASETSASMSSTEGSSFGTGGGMGAAMSLPATAKRCALVLEATVSVKTPMSGPFSHTEMVEAGQLVMTEVAGG